MLVTVTKKFNVSNDNRYCFECDGGGWSKACGYYSNPKIRSGAKRTKRKHYCKLFEVDLSVDDFSSINYSSPMKCAACLEACADI